MKKMISFMLAMIMALTIPCTAFAAEKTQLTEEELWEQVANNTATVTHDVRPLSSFTQEEIEENPELQQIFNEINKDVSRSINNKTTYGEIYTTYQMILDGAAKAPAATILANGDSPLFNSKELVNPVRFYGFDTEKHAPELTHYNTEGIVCPKCENILQYHLNTYANLGDYVCLNCDFHRPELDYKLTQLTKITNTTSEFIIDGQDYKINVGGLYNIYNALAAVSVAEFFGVVPEQIKAGFDKSRAVFGRQETFKIGDKSCTLVLIKNPDGASQALDMIKLADHPFSLSVLLNANYADGIDTSWIWDANFESILDMDIPEINAGGVRHSEIARRLRVTGYPEDKITQAEKLEDIMTLIEKQDCDHAYILATYTAMLEFRDILAQRHAVGKGMN